MTKKGHHFFPRKIGLPPQLKGPTFLARELAFKFAICCRPSICLSSVMFVHPTQAIAVVGNLSTLFSTLATHGHPGKISRRCPSVGELKHEG